MATKKKRKATRSLAERARDPNEQRKSAFAEIAQFHLRIDAALVLAGYDAAPEDARIAREYLDGAAQAIRDGDAAQAFRRCNVMRDLLIKLKGAPDVSRGTRNDVQAIKLENLSRTRGAGGAAGRLKRAKNAAARDAAAIQRAKDLQQRLGWTAKRISEGEDFLWHDAQGYKKARSPARLAKIIGPHLLLRPGRPQKSVG